ncbi:MAG: CRTAC1 family protein [Chloroflexi bacterium]|nr:CRTAC1 family protein [Chloroflexota bacterium]
MKTHIIRQTITKQLPSKLPPPAALIVTVVAVLALPVLACSEERVPPPPRTTVTPITRVLPAPAPTAVPTAAPMQAAIGGGASGGSGSASTGAVGSTNTDSTDTGNTGTTGNATGASGITVSAGSIRTVGATGGSAAAPSEGAEIRSRRYRQPGFIGVSTDDVAPFTNIAERAMGEQFAVANDLTGVAIFDYDRDGDHDFYITQSRGNPNLLFRNDGGDSFTEVGVQAGVSANASNSTGVVTCDIDNDGYQDIYLSAQGIIGDGLDYEDAVYDSALREAVSDRLMRNNGDGTFTDITAGAFGDEANFRTGTSPACADIDRDGWVDIFVANRSDMDSVHPGVLTRGNENVLYHNDGDGTFTEISVDAGVRGEQVVTWASLFFDFDDDGDPDLWTADDGGPVRIYRNDTENNRVRFTPVERPMGLDKRGNWMGFALGDYDGDADLDVFVTNIGYHPKTRPLPFEGASGDCSSEQLYSVSTCAHYLLRNDGTMVVPRLGEVGFFPDVAPTVPIEPNRVMPPDSIDPGRIWLDWRVPTGLAAYDFGFGAVFFDMENDGDQDLYWTGAALGRGESPEGRWFPSAGRMLRGDGAGNFQDITVEARLLNIKDVDYGVLDPLSAQFDRERQRIDTAYHENGKGLAKGDLNGDGYIDLIGTNSAGPIYLDPSAGTDSALGFENGPTFVWLNGGGDNNWLALRLRGRMVEDGTGSNADAIGARVFVSTTGADGRRQVQTDDVTAGSSFLSMSTLDLHFGVANASIADEITIFWPSGVRQVIRNIPVNQVYEITEPALPQ